MRIILLLFFLVALILPKSSYSQTFFGGINIGRYSFTEVPMQNFAGKFNAGWAFSKTADNRLIQFGVSTDVYKIKNNLTWDGITRGISLGYKFDDDSDFSSEVMFHGMTNRSTGKRTNVTTGQEESFMLVSKFGGIQWVATVKATNRIDFFVGMGVSGFKLKYSWKGTETVKRTTIGYNVKTSRINNLALLVPMGFNIKLIEFEGGSFHIRPQYTVAIPGLTETKTGVLSRSYIYNLNNIQVAILFGFNR